MMNPLEDTKIYAVNDPILDFQDDDYVFFKGGETIDVSVEPATSNSTNTTLFNIYPPDVQTAVDRLFYIRMEVELQFSGKAPAGQGLLQSGCDAFRCMPIASVTNNLSMQINETNTSLEVSRYLPALYRYHNSYDVREHYYGLAPSQPDLSQTYDELYLSNRNPLASKVDVADLSAYPRGGFPYTQLVNGIGNGTTGGDAAVISTLRAVITEPIFLSPLVWGGEQDKGLMNVRQIKFTFNWENQLDRMWSHSDASGAVDFSVDSVQFLNAEMLVRYVQPDYNVEIPKDIWYKYYNVVGHVTSKNAITAAGDTDTIRSRNMQLSSIPSRMYIFIQRQLSDRSVTTTDTFAQINKISVQFGNRAGILSNASREQLYLMSAKNGLKMTYADFVGEGSYLLSGGDNINLSGAGSIVCLEFGSDIPLRADEAPALGQNYNLNIDVDYKNISSEDITFELYILSIEAGMMVLKDGSYTKYSGQLTRDQIRDAEESGRYSYQDLAMVSGYGNFFEKVKRLGRKALDVVKRVGPDVFKAIEDELPEIAQKVLPMVLKLLAAAGEIEGGLTIGGQKMSRKQLRQRLRELQ